MTVRNTLVSQLLDKATRTARITPDARLILDNDERLNFSSWRRLSPADCQVSNPHLITIVGDNSGSIHEAGREQDVIDGTNSCLDTLAAAETSGSMWVQIIWIDGQQFLAPTLVKLAPRLNTSNYTANGGTPMYDTQIKVVGSGILTVQEFAEESLPLTFSSMLVTDGQDTSSRFAVEDCFKVMEGSLSTKRKAHLVAAMGIGADKDMFDGIFAQMGIPQRWRFLPGTSREELLRFFQTFSRSSIAVSQSAANLSRLQKSGPDGEQCTQPDVIE